MPPRVAQVDAVELGAPGPDAPQRDEDLLEEALRVEPAVGRATAEHVEHVADSRARQRPPERLQQQHPKPAGETDQRVIGGDLKPAASRRSSSLASAMASARQGCEGSLREQSRLEHAKTRDGEASERLNVCPVWVP